MIARFEDFELDTVECRITQAGQTVRLEKLPLDLLTLLVEQAGTLVKRETIVARLWDETTFVDSEQAIHTAVRKIRTALSDSSANPRCIETVPRRGYRFIAPVTVMPEVASSPVPTVQPKRWLAVMAGTTVAVLATLALLASSATRTSTRPELRWTPLTKSVRIHTNLPLASDGINAYWTEYDEQGCRPMEVPLEGGDPQPVRMPFLNAFVLDADKAGNLLLNVRDHCKNMEIAGLLWEFDTRTGHARRLGDLTAQAASYSPDGRGVVLGRGNELWLANRDGSGARRLASMNGVVYIARWSPDGRQIRFSAAVVDESRFTLWETTPDGRQLRNLLPDRKDTSARWGGAWSSAGKGFIFEANRGSSTDLWRMPTGGWLSSSPLIEQVSAGPLDFGSPVAIPGRDELLVAGTRKQGVLQRYDRGTGRFVPYLNGISAEMVDYSRDGAWMVYVSHPDGQVWRSRSDGSQPVQLTQAPIMRAGMPRISPDMKRIVFSAERPGEALRLYLIPFSGGNPVPATTDRKSIEVSPTWSPDGNRLLFRLDQPNGTGALQHHVLQILDLASHIVTTLPDSASRFNQRWSPDGRWIVATLNDESELDLFDLVSRRWTVLATVPSDYPAWSADSRFVYFVSNVDNRACIHRVSLASRLIEPVASLAESEREIDETWGQWAGLNPQGEPLIMANGDIQQLYLLSFERR